MVKYNIIKPFRMDSNCGQIIKTISVVDMLLTIIDKSVYYAGHFLAVPDTILH